MSQNAHSGIHIFIVLLMWSFRAKGSDSLRKIIPTDIDVREGEDIQVRLTEVLHEEASCYVRTPGMVSCNLKVDDPELNPEGCGSRINYWSPRGECGFQLTNVSKAEDSGVWRLLASNVTGGRLINEVTVRVLDRYDSDDSEESVLAGYSYTLTFSDVEEYCLVQNPHGHNQSTIFSQCHVDINKVTAADEGSWTAVVGVTGQMQEMVKTTKLNVFHEHLNVGYKNSSDFKLLHLYCNLIAEEHNLALCRFSKSLLNKVGFRLKEGLRSGRYSYYGNGLNNGDCGLTIESPEENDYGQWYCLVSTHDKYPIGASLYVSKTAYKPSGEDTVDYSVVKTWSTTPVLTTISKDLDLECFSTAALSYCWFIQPNGEVLRWTSSHLSQQGINRTEDVGTINYVQEGLPSGKCKVTLTDLDMKYNGTWSCHMGPSKPGPEISHNITVRIAETPLAAIDKLVYAEERGRATLKCKSVPRIVALRYCRFYSPKGFGININERIVEERPIRRENVSYWFSGKSINRGDCGMVIDNVSSEHNGEWTCAARLEAQELDDESFDTIHLQILSTVTYNEFTTDIDTANVTAGASVGIGIGVLVTVLLIGFLIFYVKGRLNCRNRANTGVAVLHAAEGRTTVTSRRSTLTSVHSGSSEGSSTPL